MRRSRKSFPVPSFGRQVAVFLTVLALFAAPAHSSSANRPAPLATGMVITHDESRSDGFAENGGGLASSGPTAIIQNAAASFTANTAFSAGGGLYSQEAVTLQDSASATFVHNSAGLQGGGVYSGGPLVSTENTHFTATDNVAALGGGAYADGSISLAGNADFSTNTAKDKGGALFATDTVTLTGNAVFSGNRALEGGAIYTDGAVSLAPGANKSIRFVTASDSIRAETLAVGGQGLVFFNAPNAIGSSVTVTSGTARLAAANTFSNTALRVDGGTLHFGGGTVPQAESALRSTNVTGAGTSAPYAARLKGFHLGTGATLSLDMNVAGHADVPYFTLADGYAATTGADTTLYGVIGPALSQAADGRWTYSLFSGSSGAAGDFAPAGYRTSNALVSLANPRYADGEFTFDVVRTTPPPDPDPEPPIPPKPDPDPPSPGPVISGDFMGLFPENSLARDMEMLLYYDYFYNGGTVASPGPGTLIGQNAFLDRLMLVLPGGQHALTPPQRLLALESAASMADMAGAIGLLRDTGNRLRGQIFAPDSVRRTRATRTTDGFNLWAAPVYSHEIGRNRSQYGSLDAGYRSSLYGGMLGLDALFAAGTFRAGGVFTVSRGDLDSTGAGLSTTNRADAAGGALFGAWLPAPGWEIGLYTGYIEQKNTVTQANALYLQSEFDADLWQTGVNVRYAADIGNNGKRRLTTDLGVDAYRYTRDGHDISTQGKAVARMGKSTLNQVQIPFTVGLEDTFELENGASLTVDGLAGYRLTAGELAIAGDWSIPGGRQRARITGPDADRHTALLGVGALWRKEQLGMGVRYTAELASRRTSHQLSGQVWWEF